MRALPPAIRTWTTKHSVGICGVGRFMKDWNLEPTDECPLCGMREDHLHVPRCPDPRAAAEWSHQVALLVVWLKTSGSSHTMIEAIQHLLKSIRQPNLPAHQSPSTSIQRAWESQSKIGSQAFLEGRLSRLWIPVHQEYLAFIKSNRSARLWGSRLSQHLIHLGHNMWLHRNSVKQSDDSIGRQRLRRQVDSGILAEFEMGPAGLPANIKPKLPGTVDRVLRKPLDEKTTWLELVSRERRAQRRAIARQVRLMRNFFTPPS